MVIIIIRKILIKIQIIIIIFKILIAVIIIIIHIMASFYHFNYYHHFCTLWGAT